MELTTVDYSEIKLEKQMEPHLAYKTEMLMDIRRDSMLESNSVNLKDTWTVENLGAPTGARTGRMRVH